MINPPPLTALLLGLAGLLPFVWAAAVVAGFTSGAGLPLPEVLLSDGRLVMIRYGGIILPFMAGVLWGFATKARGPLTMAAYSLSVLPALWWFFMPGTGATSALSNLITGFVGVLLIDYAFFRWQLTPDWWMPLRVFLTLIVVICLCIGIFL